MNTKYTQVEATCFHCGDECKEDALLFNEKTFCCPGCKLVYEVLNENNLCNYYDLSDNPGIKQKQYFGNRFQYLENELIGEKLIKFKDTNSSHLIFHIPSMHCSSCIWLLEHLQKLDNGVINSKVDFIQKEIRIIFDHNKTSIRNIVEKLTLIGYEPELNLEQINKKIKTKSNKSRIYKIGVAGFAFGNIMLLSFPEYFANGNYNGDDFRVFFGYLILVLALPVFFYSASEFLINTLNSFRQRVINIDVPIAIGIIAMFSRSSYEIISGTGAGYFDSMTGLVFFMLIGRNFQDKTFEWLSFERDYKSYFPIAVARIKGNKEESVSVTEVEINDHLKIRSNEIIPADVLLLSAYAEIDYSFVSGESTPVLLHKGEKIFAGGKLINGVADVIVLQPISQSYLTQLWNQLPDKSENASKYQRMVAIISRWFVILTVIIASSAFVYWYSSDLTKAINSFTSVLVIACACALALSAPFTFGNMIRILGNKGIYLRNANVIERLADIDQVVFDKTGTLTHIENKTISYKGKELHDDELSAFYTLSSGSLHPLSRQLSNYLNKYQKKLILNNFKETTGKGLSAEINGLLYKLGNYEFITNEPQKQNSEKATCVYLSINDNVVGEFSFSNNYRENIEKTFQKLKRNKYQLSVISGDYNGEQSYLEKLSGQKNDLYFNMLPKDKLDFIYKKQLNNEKVLMVGDGLNDAGALIQSNVGIAIANDINNFTPASDGIILGKYFSKLPELLSFCKAGQRIILISFIISLGYNAVGIYFAVQGTLSPVIAAILMPISTSSLVLYTVIASSIKARKLKLV